MPHALRRALGPGLVLVALAGLATPAHAALGDRPLGPGDRGADVKALQRALTKLALPTAADGHFGPRTTAGVRRYERRVKMRVDGLVSRPQGRSMRRRAREAGRPAPAPAAPAAPAFGDRPLRRGMRGRDVEALQATLTRLGHPATADGDFGARTETQVRAYETAARLTVDGEVDPAQAKDMIRRAAGAPKPAPAPAPAPPAGGNVFPVRGPHTFGSTGSLFGAPRGGRSHQGQDVAAACGTPLVAAEGGTVIFAGYHSGAGYYVVIHGRDSGRSHVYMHLLAPSPLRTGGQAERGASIGAVGNTGHSYGCHLHFEIWTSPGWYRGGAPIDPLPSLRAWASAR